LAFTKWGSLAVLVAVPTAGVLVRIRGEERAVLTGIGDDYARYAEKRRRLIPGIW
jgi:protein-S-isoprenylcysteine O-methyltransferase Ste14